jgi:hypothetical protein
MLNIEDDTIEDRADIDPGTLEGTQRSELVG